MKSKVLQEFANVLFGVNVSMGLTHEQALQSANDAVKILCDTFRGEHIYFPGDRSKIKDRNERLYAAVVFGDVPIRQASARLGLSKTQGQRIIAKMRLDFETQALANRLHKNP